MSTNFGLLISFSEGGHQDKERRVLAIPSFSSPNSQCCYVALVWISSQGHLCHCKFLQLIFYLISLLSLDDLVCMYVVFNYLDIFPNLWV